MHTFHKQKLLPGAQSETLGEWETSRPTGAGRPQLTCPQGSCYRRKKGFNPRVTCHEGTGALWKQGGSRDASCMRM